MSTTPRTPSPPPGQPDITETTRILDMFKNITAKDDTPSVAPWLLQEFTIHKERLIKGL